MACSSACPTKDHATYGACLRAKSIQIDRHSLTVDTRIEARQTRALIDYADLRRNGSQPLSPRADHVEHAKKEAMKHGVFDADC